MCLKTHEYRTYFSRLGRGGVGDRGVGVGVVDSAGNAKPSKGIGVVISVSRALAGVAFERVPR